MPMYDARRAPTNLRRRGYNHLAFRVDDIEAATGHLTANGVKMLSDEMDYISRRLRFFEGPRGSRLSWCSGSTKAATSYVRPQGKRPVALTIAGVSCVLLRLASSGSIPVGT